MLLGQKESDSPVLHREFQRNRNKGCFSSLFRFPSGELDCKGVLFIQPKIPVEIERERERETDSSKISLENPKIVEFPKCKPLN